MYKMSPDLFPSGEEIDNIVSSLVRFNCEYCIESPSSSHVVEFNFESAGALRSR